MKIILTHSSKSISYNKEWIYFGCSFLKMKKWESQIRGKRINLQLEIHQQANKQRKTFLQWIENQRTANKDSLNWWMTHIAGRNNAYSKFYINLCQWFAIDEYLKKNQQLNEVLIVCENAFLVDLVKKNLRTNDIVELGTFMKVHWFVEIFSLIFVGIIRQIKLLIVLAHSYFLARITRPKILKKPTGEVVLFHHCLDKIDCFKNGNVSCKFFTILPEWLRKKNYKVFALPWLFTNRPTKNFYKKLRETNVLIPEDWLNLKDYIYVINNSFKSFTHLKFDILYPGVKINSLILKEKLSQLGEASVNFWRYVPAIKKWSSEIKSLIIYDQYQNLMFEHPLRYVVKKLPTKSTTIGFYHTLCSKEFLPYHHLESEWTSSVKPDFVACTGKISKKHLLSQGVPEEKILTAVALRQSNPRSMNNKKNKSKNLLILLSLINDANSETISKIYENNDFIINDLKLKIRVKNHPMNKTAEVLKSVKWDKLPKGWEWANENLNDELQNSYCCIAMGTSSVYDCVIQDNIVIPLMSDLNIMDNYLDLFVEKYPLLKSVTKDNLVKTLREIYELKIYEYQTEFSNVRNELVQGTNFIGSNNLQSFIKFDQVNNF
tara:strand:- start:237 stop:2048 length:1812 start_codon:yes stop_codon:yes gene_type:complete